MALRLLFLALLVVGCGAKEPAKSAANAEPPSSEAPSPKVEARPVPAAATTPSKQEPPAAATRAATPDDLREIIQAVLDDDALTSYLKLQLPNRFPLRVSGPNLPKDLQVMKSTKPVVIVDDSNRDPKKPVFAFTEIEIKGADATVKYKYDVEGVRGSATLNKPYGHWAIKQSRVAEH